MGVTITVAIAFWAAASYVEYRIIKSVPPMRHVFQHPLGGIIVSISIGIVLGMALGPQVGAGAALGQILGLATNKFTYGMYTTGGRALEHGRNTYQNASAFMDKNKNLISGAANTVKYGIQVLGAVFLTFMFIIGLPARLINAINKVRVTTS